MTEAEEKACSNCIFENCCPYEFRNCGGSKIIKKDDFMRKGEMIFDHKKRCFCRLPAIAEGSDLLLAAGISCFVAAILIAVWWRFL